MNEEIDLSRISVVMPAYNEAGAIDKVLRQTQELTNCQAEIIVVDDGSTDNTAEVAENAGAKVIRHPYNKGNGAAVKTGTLTATGDIIVFLDPDGQHDPGDIVPMVRLMGQYDLVIGSRSFKGKGGLHRNMANKIYNRLASYLTEQNIPDLTSGFRAFKRKHLLKFLHLFPNRFSYPTTSTLSFIKAGLNVGFYPIEVQTRIGKSKIKLLYDGIKFFFIILKVIVLFHPFRVFLPASLLCFIFGLLSGIIAVFSLGRLYIPNSAIVFFVTSVIIFLLGLVSEQITALRMENLEKVELNSLDKTGDNE